jgi:NAD(P)-dependent dehydrogenase (short-subunit alcohol dehydrogenase family)
MGGGRGQIRARGRVSEQTARTALVVGATQGLGLALAGHYLANGWSVVATTVGESPALAALQAEAPERFEIYPLDITDLAGVTALRETLDGRRIDSVHIVAGVFQKDFAAIWEQPDDEILRVLHTNSIGGVRLAEVFAPLVPRGGTFAFTTSGMGSLARNDRGDVDLYRISKVALNMLVRSFAARHVDSGRAVLLLCPGWAKTEMGGAEATVEVSDSVAGMYAQVASADADAGEALFIEYSGDAIAW